MSDPSNRISAPKTGSALARDVLLGETAGEGLYGFLRRDCGPTRQCFSADPRRFMTPDLCPHESPTSDPRELPDLGPHEPTLVARGAETVRGDHG